VTDGLVGAVDRRGPASAFSPCDSCNDVCRVVSTHVMSISLKRVTGAVTLLAVALVVVACGGGDEAPVETGAAETAQGETAAATTAAEPALAPEDAAALGAELDSLRDATITMMNRDVRCRAEPMGTRILCEGLEAEEYDAAVAQAEASIAAGQELVASAGPAGTTCSEYLGGFIASYRYEFDLERARQVDLDAAGDDAEKIARADDPYYRGMIENRGVDPAAAIGSVLAVCRALSNQEVGQSTLAIDLANYFYAASWLASNVGINLALATFCANDPALQDLAKAERAPKIAACIQELTRLDALREAYETQSSAWLKATANPGFASVSPECAQLVEADTALADEAVSALADLVESALGGGVEPDQVTALSEKPAAYLEALAFPRVGITACVDEATGVANAG